MQLKKLKIQRLRGIFPIGLLGLRIEDVVVAK